MKWQALEQPVMEAATEEMLHSNLIWSNVSNWYEM